MRTPSIKQRKIEQAETRKRKQKEFEDQYDCDVAGIKELLHKDSSELDARDLVMADWFKLNDFSELLPKALVVEEKLKQFDDAQSILVSGVYRDEQKLASKYREKFIEYYREANADAFEELRALIPLYRRVFRNDLRSYQRVFDLNASSILMNPDLSVAGFIRAEISRASEDLQRDLAFIDVRSHMTTERDPEYAWGHHFVLLGLLNFFNHRQMFADTAAEKKVVDSITNLLVCTPADGSKDLTREGGCKDILEVVGVHITNRILASADPGFFVSRSYGIIGQIITADRSSAGGQDARVADFVDLQFALLDWAGRWHLEKDWILIYAYYFIEYLSQVPEADVSEVDLPCFWGRSLRTEQFHFKCDAWFPGDESKDEYELYAKTMFNKQLENYFENWGKQLGLNRLKKVTRPVDPDSDAVKWVIVWNRGETYGAIAKEFGRGRKTIIDGLIALKPFGLPIRPGLPGRPRKKSIEYAAADKRVSIE